MKQLSSAERIALLNSYLSILPPRWAAQQSYIAMYFSICFAIVGFAGTQIHTAVQNNIEIILVLPLLSAAVMSYFAIASIERQERHIRELIVLTAKIEQSLGLHEKSLTADEATLWPDDPHVLPVEWVSSRLKVGSRSSDFISASIGSTSRIARRIFVCIMVASIVLSAVCAAVQFDIVELNQPTVSPSP